MGLARRPTRPPHCRGDSNVSDRRGPLSDDTTLQDNNDVAAATSRVAHIAKCWRTFLNFLTEQVLAEFPEERYAERVLKEQVHSADISGPDGDRDVMALVPKLTLQQVSTANSAEQERSKALQEKGKSNVLGITVAFSVLFAGVGFLFGEDVRIALGSVVSAIAMLFLILGVVFLAAGGLMAMKAMNIGPWYNLTLHDVANEDEAKQTSILLWCLYQNYRITALRSNAVSVSMRAIRNGVLILALLVLLVGTRLLILPSSESPQSHGHNRQTRPRASRCDGITPPPHPTAKFADGMQLLWLGQHDVSMPIEKCRTAGR